MYELEWLGGASFRGRECFICHFSLSAARTDVSRGYARTYCCPTRGIVLGLSEVGMVGIKGVVGGSEGRRGE